MRLDQGTSDIQQMSGTRPCLRSVPAHRIVGGVLGRRYDEAARRNEGGETMPRAQNRRLRTQAPMATTQGVGPDGPHRPTSQAHFEEPQGAADRGIGEVGGLEGAEGVLRPLEVEIFRRESGAFEIGSINGGDAAVGVLRAGAPESLVDLCLDTMVAGWESAGSAYLPHVYHMPHELCARLLKRLVVAGKLTGFVLSGFLTPAALEVDLTGAATVQNCVFKQLGVSCPSLIHLNLSMCPQVNNSVVRCVLQGCSKLRQLYLDGCHRVTDAGFHLQQSPFYVLVGAVSLETLSVQGCPQVTGSLVLHLRKLCRNLKELNMARCKSVSGDSLQRLFDSCPTLESLNVSFLETATEEAFRALPLVDPLPVPQDNRASVSTIFNSETAWLPPLRHLNLGSCGGLTDLGLSRVGCFRSLESVHLENCLHVTDEGLLALARRCPMLQGVGLGNCGQVTDKTLTAFSAWCRLLEWVDFSWCGLVTDQGFKALSEGCPELEEVRAVWCEGMTDLSLKALSTCEHLRAVHINGCSGVTNGGVLSLRIQGVHVFQ